ncbi:PH domain-containing protein [Tsukamurella spumae]|uniref:PH domain-containing protein n=1 Tax=Tsukamurella spumae TaxID=44753 RepID=A0A846WZ59_9ACTN|nr:PH domain-containing protein [Tsukamurella spumae]NKY18244.1 PH domain-containing protein [Tsukamurella spumae]
MAFPEKALIDDERVLLHVRPHAKRLIVPVLVLFAACAAAGVALGLIGRAHLDGAWPDWLLLAVVVAWLGVVGWWTMRPWASWRATHLVVTDLRIMFRSGIVRRRGIDIPLRRINSVQYHQRLVDRMLRCGVLTVESAGEDPLDFPDVPRIAGTHALIVDALDDADDYRGRDDGSAEYSRRS